MSDDASTPTPAERSVEATRSLFEQALSAQKAAVDGWAAAFERSPAAATSARETKWLADVWLETIENALVHGDDALDETGIDLDALQTIWLHAADDALTDVGRSDEFAETMTEAVERSLAGQSEAAEARRAFLGAAGLPTDRDVEEVGARILDFEYQQKSVEDALDAVAAAIEAGTESDDEAEAASNDEEESADEAGAESTDEEEADDENDESV